VGEALEEELSRSTIADTADVLARSNEPQRAKTRGSRKRARQ
jgi:hypothetical protein